MGAHPQTLADQAFVPRPEVPAWEAAGWRVTGPLPGSHARYSVLMERDGRTFNDLANERQPEQAA